MPTLSLSQIAQAVTSGERSATEVLETFITRIEATEARVNAFTGTRFEAARTQAQRVDTQRARGEPLGPLAGVPFAVKNLFDIAGEVTLAGSKVNRSHPPATTDAVLVQRLQMAGAVLVGSLNMDEYAYGFTTENTHYGPTRNPHQLDCVAGGSSGGSGAAVAAGQVPLTLGSDTNGSIRVPSSLCGVWGLKPTFGRLSRRGSFPFVHSIDHLGPFASDLPGLALAYDALQGPDPLDPGCFATAVEPVSHSLGQGVHGLRIGVLGGYFIEHATPPAQQAVAMAAEALRAHTAVHDGVEWPDAAQARAAAFIVTASEGGSLHLPALRTQAVDYEPLSVDRLIAGALQPATWYARAQRFRRVYRDKVNALFRDWDVLIAPATPLAATPIGTEWIDINGTRFPCRPSMGLLTQPISFAGCPVVAAPLWPSGTDGLPIGTQLIAAPWREDLALRVAQVLASSGVARVKEAPL
ncbi:amidase/aspartyl-tRNA(Asn)/glutamyl-tRNA(Gln) amidotransferase subunit A [Hydrogenophaga palleronii]|uniref:Amidase/aspartyl-tRNA(Asn)/glutamyl-tRNA(Gln) amidotransferase subunit A n=1 Tax=Hydrogenophaga palleronii TaxID=65655 RepID=A0ABU1WND7_9BURK|nr:AtzE family amidohydrolase [Hydrogenophaga palleronii]MDR7150815.1 amidase/aspartyl-tRNA(Asn)/glutamyl-tRNA(Gln) amidotransferase subunit A [Hydrogenophaga palleronii]